jgi:hypothetical protein
MMAAWILLIAVSCVALWVAVSLNKPTLIAATAAAAGLSSLMLILRMFLAQRVRRATRRR